MEAEATNIQNLAKAAVKSEFDAGKRQAITDGAKAQTTTQVSTSLKANTNLVNVLKAGLIASGAATSTDAEAKAYAMIEQIASGIGENSGASVAAACENAATQAAQTAAVTGAKQGSRKKVP